MDTIREFKMTSFGMWIKMIWNFTFQKLDCMPYLSFTRNHIVIHKNMGFGREGHKHHFYNSVSSFTRNHMVMHRTKTY